MNIQGWFPLGLTKGLQELVMNREAWHAAIHGVTKSQTWLSDWTELQLHPSIKSWIKHLLSMAPPIRTRASVPLSQSIPSGSFHKPFIVLYQRAAAKSLQSCPTLCDPIDSSPPGSSVHGIFQARVLEWCAITFSEADRLKTTITEN